MVVVENERVGDIPILHLVEKKHFSEEMPFILFMHGFTSFKERNLHYAYLLAEKGFRVVLPEAVYHGERRETISNTDLNLRFWDIVLNTIGEINTVKEFFEDKGLIDSKRIGLSGTSMGAIITLGALTQYDWVKAAVSLMGMPAYETFAKYQMEQIEKYGVSMHISEEYKEKTFEKLRPFDISKQPSKLNNRPLLFWHGQMDSEVPFTPTFEFYDKIKKNYYQDNEKLAFIADDKAGHNVTQEGVEKTVEWFEKHL